MPAVARRSKKPGRGDALTPCLPITGTVVGSGYLPGVRSHRALASVADLELARIIDLVVGDVITEVDTPAGPFYTVNSVDLTKDEFVVDEVALPVDDQHAFVLRRRDGLRRRVGRYS